EVTTEFGIDRDSVLGNLNSAGDGVTGRSLHFLAHRFSHGSDIHLDSSSLYDSGERLQNFFSAPLIIYNCLNLQLSVRGSSNAGPLTNAAPDLMQLIKSI